MTPALDAHGIREVNTRYHDFAASHYDSKWGIDFGELGRSQVAAKLRRALGRQVGHFARGLEIGAGTGYFTLNLLQAGVIGEATCTDISPGMLEALGANAAALALDVRTVVADAELLPFEDESFDIVYGHAVLHHIPHLERAFAEFARVLAPGGTLAFAGEPSRWGDRLARVPKRLAGAAAPAWRTVMRAAPAAAVPNEHSGASLEGEVDVHAFTPGALAAFAQDAGLVDVRVRGEELLANWFGWANRTLEATARPEDVPWLWRRYAFHGYLALQRVDRAVLESRMPAAVFYNLLLAARKPAP